MRCLRICRWLFLSPSRAKFHWMLSVGSPERTLRLRASVFADFMREHGWNRETAAVETREPVATGDALTLEISLGPLADEVLLRGTIEAVENLGAGSVATLRFSVGQGERLRHVEEVLEGDRKAAARGSRRHPSNMAINWQHGEHRHRSRLRDISRGGAFILAEQAPRIGDRVCVTLRGDDKALLQVPSVVSWIRGAGSRGDPVAGFGVCFKPTDPASAKRLTHVVRLHEDAAACA